VKSGRLEWSPVHRSEKFWHENAARLNEKNFELLKSVAHSVCITHPRPFKGPLSWTTRVSRYQKGKTNLDFTEARDSEWQSHQLGHMQVCNSHQTDNHASTPPLSFLQSGCPSCRPTNSIKALKAQISPHQLLATITDE